MIANERDGGTATKKKNKSKRKSNSLWLQALPKSDTDNKSSPLQCRLDLLKNVFPSTYVTCNSRKRRDDKKKPTRRKWPESFSPQRGTKRETLHNQIPLRTRGMRWCVPVTRTVSVISESRGCSLVGKEQGI